ncbi:hypothetical protein BC936DRAFT_142617, partial [Jimgerdemannia flammicorona]
MALKEVALSSGSACTSASLEPSYVLRALGADDETAHSSIRFGIGRFTTEEEVDFVVDRVVSHVDKLREMSPLWEMDILECLNDMQIPFTEEDLSKPTSNKMQLVYEAFMDIVMGVTSEQYEQPVQRVLEELEYPDIEQLKKVKNAQTDKMVGGG